MSQWNISLLATFDHWIFGYRVDTWLEAKECPSNYATATFILVTHKCLVTSLMMEQLSGKKKKKSPWPVWQGSLVWELCSRWEVGGSQLPWVLARAQKAPPPFSTKPDWKNLLAQATTDRKWSRLWVPTWLLHKQTFWYPGTLAALKIGARRGTCRSLGN